MSPRFAVILALLLLVAATGSLSGEEFGNISEAEWSMPPPEADPEAGAIVLFDRGVLEISLKHKIRFYRHVRIKVFNKDAAENALTVEIPFFKGEKIKDLTACTYLPGGKIIKVKDVFEKEIGSMRVATFAFPSVEDDVILEYKYRHEHRRYNFLDPWMFQADIYTKKSVFSVVLDDGMVYDYYESNIPLGSSHPKEEMYPDDFKDAKAMYTWELEDLPALKSEPLMAMVKDYTSHIYIHMIAIYFYMNELSFVNNWADVGNLYQSWVDSFAVGYESLDSIATVVCDDSADIGTQISELYRYVRDDYETRGYMGCFLEDSGLADLVKNEYGTATEKNILLTMLLRARDIDAFPLLIGTSEYSEFKSNEYNLRQFDRAICLALGGEDSLILDTDDRLVPFPFLPCEDMAVGGLIIDGEDSKVITLNHRPRNSSNQLNTVMSINSEGDAGCSTHICVHGHALGEYRELLEDSLSMEKVAEDLLAEFQTNYEFIECSLKLDLPGDSMTLDLVYNLPRYASRVGDNMFITPFVIPVTDNPFTEKSRYFPADFKFPFSKYHKVVINIPEGYELADVPTEISYTIEGAKFYRTFFEGANSVELTVFLNIRNPLFRPDKYADLKKMFDALSESCFDQIAISPLGR
jgi:hypothetical protein